MSLVLSGDGSVGPLSATEVGYLDGVTSAVQTQINAKLTTPGAWTSYTPTWTNLTIGNGTTSGYYTQIGKTVHVRVTVELGSTSSVGTDPTFTLPVTAASAGYRTTASPIGTAYLRDAGLASYYGMVSWNSTTTGIVQAVSVSGSTVRVTAISSTAPWSWGASDYMELSFTYEAA